MKYLVLLSLSAPFLALPAAAQHASTNMIDHAPPITVRGIPDSPANPKANLNPRIPGSFQIRASNAYSRANIFVHCAEPDAKTLYPILEGPPNEANTATAQGFLVMRKAGCRLGDGISSGGETPADAGRFSSVALPNMDWGTDGLPSAFYQRGALIEYAIKKYAGDVQLTRDDTHKETVVNRFVAVEQGRNRYRWPEDLAYFRVAACMVQAQPGLAGDLLASTPGSEHAARVGYAIIQRAHLCVPGAGHIEVDPTQFRVYIADAYYRWAEAIKGVDALIPAA